MDLDRFRKGAALRYVPLLTVLLLIIAPAVGGSQSPGKPKVDRLVMGLITPYLDYVRPWINGTADHNIQHDPMQEWLIEVDPSGQYKPWLADSWTLGPGGRSWRVKLHKGVQFHHGYGEFTAQDVSTPMPSGATRITPGAKTCRSPATRPASARSRRSRWSIHTRSPCTARSCVSTCRSTTRARRTS